MTREQFFQSFDAYLEVSEPERREIIHELETHTDELAESTDYLTFLGNPKKLAQRYNRVHIGALYARWHILLAPVVLWVGILAINVLPSDLKALAWTSNIAGVGYYLQQFCSYLFPILFTVYLGRILVRRKNSGFEFTCLLGEAVALIGAYGTASTYQSQGEFYELFSLGLWVGILGAIGFALVLIVSMVYAKKPVTNNSVRDTVGARLTLEVVVFLFVSFISFMSIGLLTGTIFAPYEAQINKPPDGTALRLINDFFDSRMIFGPWALFEAGFIWIMIKRIRKYYQLNVHDAFAWVSAFAFGVAAAIIDGYTFSYTPVFMMIFFASITLGFFKPERPWRWAFMLAATMPIIQIMLAMFTPEGFGQKNHWGTAFFITFPAAYLGRAIWLYRKQHSEKKVA